MLSFSGFTLCLDHRVNARLSGLEQLLAGPGLDELVRHLQAHFKEQRLAALFESSPPEQET